MAALLKLMHFFKKIGRLSSAGHEISAFGSHCSVIFQPILDYFIPNFKLRCEDSESIKEDRFQLTSYQTEELFLDTQYTVSELPMETFDIKTLYYVTFTKIFNPLCYQRFLSKDRLAWGIKSQVGFSNILFMTFRTIHEVYYVGTFAVHMVVDFV